MTYRFHRCQCHPKCPDLTGWYLEIKPDNGETVMKVHRGICGLYFFKFGMTPYSQANKDWRAFYDPLRLAAGWLMSVEHYLMNGETILVNSNGGIMPMDGAKILDTVESTNLHWNDRFDDEIVTIFRWPQAEHWYLASNKHRVFIPGKYNTYKAAEREALCYVPTDRIKTKDCTGALPPE